MFFQEDHLRITKIKTVNGITPQTGEDERPVKKTIFAPLNKDTRKLFEDQNKRLPNNIKMKIEVVKAYHPEPIPQAPSVDVSALEERIKALEAENNSLKTNKVSSESSNGSVNTENPKEKSTGNPQTKIVTNDPK